MLECIGKNQPLCGAVISLPARALATGSDLCTRLPPPMVGRAAQTEGVGRGRREPAGYGLLC